MTKRYRLILGGLINREFNRAFILSLRGRDMDNDPLILVYVSIAVSRATSIWIAPQRS